MLSSSNEIHISLDKGTNHHFTPGEDISGEVTLHLKEPKTYTDFVITYKGRAKTRWRARKAFNGGPDNSVKQKEDIFRVERSVSTPDDGKLGTFISGSHHFKFTFVLPSSIPSSAHFTEYFFANISYKIVVVLKAPMFHFDLKDTCSFLVKGLLNLNSSPWLRQPHEIYKVAPVSGGCFRGNAGEVEYKVMLKRSAFVWGEVIPLTVEIKNHATVDIPKWSVKLVQNTVFKCEDDINTTKALIFKKKGGSIVKGGQNVGATFEDLVLEERPYSSNFGGTISLILLTYQLLIKIAPRSGTPIRERIPILIGDIPFQ